MGVVVFITTSKRFTLVRGAPPSPRLPSQSFLSVHLFLSVVVCWLRQNSARYFSWVLEVVYPANTIILLWWCQPVFVVAVCGHARSWTFHFPLASPTPVIHWKIKSRLHQLKQQTHCTVDFSCV